MGKGFGVAGLILFILSMFIPVFGNYVTFFALIIVAVGALCGDRIFAIAIPIVAAVKQFFFSPTWMALLYGPSEEVKIETMIVTVGLLALPVVAVLLNGIFKDFQNIDHKQG